MALDRDPYAPPTSTAAPSPVAWTPPPLPSGPPFARFTLVGGSPRAEWTLAVYEDWLRVDTAGAPALMINRFEFLARCDLIIGAFMRALAIRGPARIVLPLSPRALDVLRVWLEPVIDAQRSLVLARRFALGLPLAALVIFSALPIARMRMDPLALAWGTALGATSLARRFTRRRQLFLAEFVVWCLLGCTDVARLATGGGVFNAAFAALAAVFAVGAFKLYSFYGPPPALARADED